MDVFDVAAVANEMKGLEGRYIDKVYQKGEEIFIKLKGVKKEIFIKAGKWIFLSEHRESREEHPPSFAMALRKHIGNGRLLTVRQHDFDRIVIFEIYKGERYFLIAEILPGGNIILTDEKMEIILSERDILREIISKIDDVQDAIYRAVTTTEDGYAKIKLLEAYSELRNITNEIVTAFRKSEIANSTLRMPFIVLFELKR